MQRLLADFDQIQINKQHGNTTGTNVTGRVDTVGRTELTTNHYSNNYNLIYSYSKTLEH